MRVLRRRIYAKDEKNERDERGGDVSRAEANTSGIDGEERERERDGALLPSRLSRVPIKFHRI